MYRLTSSAGTVVTRLAFAVLVAFLSSGCTSLEPVSTEYKSASDVTEYETTRIGISGTEWGGGYGSSKSLEVWARSQCRGRDCTPSHVTLIFQVSGSGNLRMRNQAVELRADGKTVASTRRRGRGGSDLAGLSSAVGVVASVRMPFEDFRALVEADRLSGTIGTSSFRLRDGSRGPFRALVETVTTPADNETADDTF